MANGNGLPWFRMYGSMIDDAVIGQLSDADYRLYIELLCAACQHGQDGSTGLTVDSAAWRFRKKPAAVKKSAGNLSGIGLLTVDSEGFLWVTHWDERQRASDHSRERVKKFRDAGGELAENQQDSGGDSRYCNVTEALPKQACNGLDKIREDNIRKDKIETADKIRNQPLQQNSTTQKTEQEKEAALLKREKAKKIPQAHVEAAKLFIKQTPSWLNYLEEKQIRGGYRQNWIRHSLIPEGDNMNTDSFRTEYLEWIKYNPEALTATE